MTARITTVLQTFDLQAAHQAQILALQTARPLEVVLRLKPSVRVISGLNYRQQCRS
ncbi:hypothetical protein JCM19233_1320 [Vibrio astriarenae]|nr:hypothetical protein JCM19233_1320 [Vibrio sp. C7]